MVETHSPSLHGFPSTLGDVVAHTPSIQREQAQTHGLDPFCCHYWSKRPYPSLPLAESTKVIGHPVSWYCNSQGRGADIFLSSEESISLADRMVMDLTEKKLGSATISLVTDSR